MPANPRKPIAYELIRVQGQEQHASLDPRGMRRSEKQVRGSTDGQSRTALRLGQHAPATSQKGLDRFLGSSKLTCSAEVLAKVRTS